MSPWIIALVIADTLLLFWAVGAYNRLIRLRNEIQNAFGQIDVQLKRRYDLIPNLVEAAKKYMAHERETLEAVIHARNRASEARQTAKNALGKAGEVGSLAALAQAETQLGGEMSNFFGLSERYPELKADRTITDLNEELISTENRIGFSRQAYNDAALAYNDAAQQFPALLIAKLFNFAPRAMLQSTENDQERAAIRIRL